jgi:hypothetical protein
MAVLLWARLIFPAILLGVVALYAWAAYRTENRK